MKFTFYTILFIAFVDFLGYGLVYPVFSSMLFDTTCPLLPYDTSHSTRGLFLGLLIAAAPLAQFFSAPVWGAISDGKGRKKPLQISLCIAFLGHFLSFLGTASHSLSLLLFSRLIEGIAIGNMSIVQASIADLSTPETKGKNFSLYGMALGVGFTIGPFFGGFLAKWGYEIPFLFAGALVLLNILSTIFYFNETNFQRVTKALSWTMGIWNLKQATQIKGIRAIFLASFFHNFGWTFFFEFSPVFLISKFHFTTDLLGIYFGFSGGIYALSTGILIRPFVKRFRPEVLYFAGMFLGSFAILALALLNSVNWLWPGIALITFFVAFVWPMATTLVSNRAAPEIQGEALGILTSITAASLILSSLFSGSLVGNHPTLPMFGGGVSLFLGSMVILGAFGKSLYRKSM